MTTTQPGRRKARPGPAPLLALGAVLAAGSALAQNEPMSTAPADAAPTQAAAPAAPPPSELVAVNLIRLLVKQGTISQAAGDGLIAEAEAEARQARLAAATPAEPPPPAAGVIRVPYVPEFVRNQIKDDIKKDVIAQAKEEGWASPGTFPDWISRIQWFGDFRFRDQFNFFSDNNVSPFIDYSTFNASGPIDINANTGKAGVPLLNTRANRINELSLRARLGANIKVFDGVAATVRLATGSDNSPVSTTQILGGGLGKKNIWLDQAYLTLTPVYWAKAVFGRQPDPFMHTDLVFDDNLNFDGVTALADQQIGEQGLRLFGAAGVYPLDYISNNFPTNSADKAPQSIKWLYAVQAGASFQPDALSWSVKGAVAFYDYQNVAGQLSAPCALYTGVTQCSTDFSRPSFMQKGNTLFLLRNITPNPALADGFTPLPQYVGLSYNYREINAVGEAEVPLAGGARAQLQVDYARNLAYDPSRILAANSQTPPITNFGADTAEAGGTIVPGHYRSGPDAFMVKVTVGALHPVAKGDWNFAAGYKYIEPDAVIDAFNDHDFHQGGTNAKGYFLSGAYYFANNTWLLARWLSATEVFGPPLSIDVLQLELNTRF